MSFQVTELLQSVDCRGAAACGLAQYGMIPHADSWCTLFLGYTIASCKLLRDLMLFDVIVAAAVEHTG